MPPERESPRFSLLPIDPRHPQHSAWGVWGDDDRLGTLNHLTPERVAAASKEIRTGIRIGLNWPLDQQYLRPKFRQQTEHTISNIAPSMHVCYGHDPWPHQEGNILNYRNTILIRNDCLLLG